MTRRSSVEDRAAGDHQVGTGRGDLSDVRLALGEHGLDLRLVEERSWERREGFLLLNPAAVEPVGQAWEALHGRAYLGKKWIFEGDPTLPPGGCTVRYDHGFVEAGLEAQLEEIGIALDRAIPSLARGTVEEEVA